MPRFELYSARVRKLARGNDPDVYVFDQIPESLRVQLSQILSDSIGVYDDREFGANYHNNDAWDKIARMLRKEKGKDYLYSTSADSQQEVLGFLRSGSVDDVLDVVHACSYYLYKAARDFDSTDQRIRGIAQSADDALEEINHRFRESAIGYQVEQGEIVRVDSQFLHNETVKPALSILQDIRFKGAQEEFLAAHAAYRSGDAAEAITGANRAFESTMKVICDIKGWTYAKGARASDLIKVLKQNSLFPDYLDGSFEQLVSTLASGLPKVRDNAGGHGQGSKPRKTPDHVASYAMHLAATKIVFLVGAALDGDRSGTDS